GACALAFSIGITMALASCAAPVRTSTLTPLDPAVVAMYAPVENEPFRIPAADIRKVEPRYYRQRVSTPIHIGAAPGTIVVDPSNRFLYLVEEGGTSMRYGIGVG